MQNLSLKHKSLLESIIGKMWMYKSTNYLFTDYTHIGESIIFSTDVKAITIEVGQIEDFKKELLPVDSTPASSSISATAQIPGIESSIFSELAGGLMSSFREIQGAKGTDEKFLQQAIRRSKAKVEITKAVTDIAKTAIAGQKLLKTKS